VYSAQAPYTLRRVDVSTAVSYGCAVLASVGNATANVMQRKASLSQPDLPFGPRLLWGLVRTPTWLLGFAGLVASFVLQAVALSNGELSGIEPIITLEVPLTLLVASFVFSGRLSGGDWASILTMTIGMIVLVGALSPSGGDATKVDHLTYIAAGGATAATIVALIIAAQRGGQLWRTACLGAAAGTSFGMTATLIKETTAQLSDHGVEGVLTTWQTYVAACFGILGLLLVQAALHQGPLVAAQPGFTLMDPLVSILWGVLVFDEQTRTGWWLVLATLGAIGVGTGVFRLANSPLLAEVKEELPTARRPAAHVRFGEA
jgi:drug/metabolite transporter (DMT)-like permease